MTKPKPTRLSKTGQPVMGTQVEVPVIGHRHPERREFWVPGEVVGKLCGPGGSADLVGLIVEVADSDGVVRRVRTGPVEGSGWRCIR